MDIRTKAVNGGERGNDRPLTPVAIKSKKIA
jgi:hypothetical protein